MAALACPPEKSPIVHIRLRPMMPDGSPKTCGRRFTGAWKSLPKRATKQKRKRGRVNWLAG